MKRTLGIVFAAIFATSSGAQAVDETAPDPLIVPGDMEDLSEFRWKKRPVLVFANSPDDPAFIEQLELLKEREDALRERDIIVLTDTDPDAKSPLRLKMRPRGFMLVLVGKDGGTKLRKPFPWSVREISRSVDKMPMRQREIREQKALN